MANKNFKARIGIEAPLIAADNGTTAITLTGANAVVAGTLGVTGDLTVSGNDIKSSTATALSFLGADVTVAGNLRINGNEIQTAGGPTAITLSGTDVTVEGDLTVAYALVLNGPASGSVTIAAPATAGTQAYTLPTALPAVTGYVLSGTTGGVLSWAANPDTNTTYTQDASVTTGGANLNLTGSDATTDTVKFAGGTNVTVTATDANTVTIAATDTNTTYDFAATSATGGANLILTGSDATTDTVKISNGTGVTVAQVSGTEVSVAIGQDVATSASPTFVGVTATGNITTAGAAANRFTRTAAGTGNTIPLILNRNRTDAARANNNGPWLAFEYQGTDNTQATSPIAAVRSQYDTTGRNYLELLELAGSYSTGVQIITRFKRGDYQFKNTTGGNAFQLDDDNCSITGQVATAGVQNLLFLTKRRTDVAAPTDGDLADFRIAFQGNTGSAITVGKFEGEYNATTGHKFTMNVAEASGATSIVTVETTQKQTTINAIPTAGGAPAAVATFNRDNIILGGTTGTQTGNNIIYNRVHGQWQYIATITPAAADTAYAVPFQGTNAVTDFANIASTASTSRIIFGAAGMYKLQFSAQVENTDNAQDHEITFWWRKNGVDVPNSAGHVTIPRAAVAAGASIVGWDNMAQSANATDYYELMYAVSDTAVTMPFIAAAAPRPGAAAVFLTLIPIGA